MPLEQCAASRDCLRTYVGHSPCQLENRRIPIPTVLTKMGNDYKELRRCFTEQEAVQNVHNENMISTG